MKHIGENVVRIEAEALRALADRIAGPMAEGFNRAVELLAGCAGVGGEDFRQIVRSADVSSRWAVSRSVGLVRGLKTISISSASAVASQVLFKTSQTVVLAVTATLLAQSPLSLPSEIT